MRFIPSRNLRIEPGKVWRELNDEGGLVVTSRGQPVAVMLPVSGENLDQTLRMVHRMRLAETMRKIQEESVRNGTNTLTMAEIDEEVRLARLERRQKDSR